jgi:tetratricopeptide (TPR) repeat protein
VVSAQERADVPAWVAFERAEEASREGPDRDYAEALRLYSQALAAQPLYPEAHAGIARIYRTEGDIAMARRHYERALEQSPALQIPDEEYALRIELAEMYLQTGTNDEYRNALQRVINRDPVFAGLDGSRQREAMRDRLHESGLNRVLTLYRLDFPQSLAAHRHYADYLLQQGSRDETAAAVEHLLFAIVEIAGRAVDAIIDREFDYQFTSVADLLLTARRFPEVQRYLDESDFLGLLLQLAAALDVTETPGAAVAADGIRRDLQAALSLQR